MALAIKLQKARRIIGKNGFFNGGIIVSGYLKDYLRSFIVGTGDILFVTGGIGDKAHFRAFGVAEELRTHGFKCAVTVSDNFRLTSLASQFKIFILHKLTYDKKISEFVSEIKKQNKIIIFDTDDLDYDPRFLDKMDYFQNISKTERKEYEKGIGAEIVNDPYVKVATTTVSYLADKLRERGKQVFIVSNKISKGEVGIAEKVLKKDKAKDGFIRIGYYSGTPSHNKDFATVADALLQILEKHENVKLILAGLLDKDDKLSRFASRIESLPRVPRDEYYANVRKCDINIAPLEIDNPFCEAKSEIKFIEAGILAIPTVAVRNRTYSEAIIEGVDGFLAGTTQEWVDKLSRLIQDEEMRLEMGRRAREKVLREYTNQNSRSEDYYEYLRNSLKKK